MSATTTSGRFETRAGAASRLALLALLALTLPVVAQPGTTVTSKGDATRVLSANAADVSDGKDAAARLCAACHGATGISTTDGVPNLAGQRPVYLYTELRAYQSGVRTDSSMRGVVQVLSNDALVKLAAYYASLDPAQPAQGRGATAPPSTDPLQAARTIAATCGGCHGDNGVSKTPGTPSLAGLDPKYFASAMQAYKTGRRKNDLMKGMAATVSDSDVASVALYYALQKPGQPQLAKSGDAASGKGQSATCAACHGEKGVSTSSGTPSLAGQDPTYIAGALAAYRDGSRSDDTMRALAGSLDPVTVRNLAAYYASQQAQAPPVTRPLSTADWVQRCDRCHGTGGNSTDPALPMLAAQRVEYLAKTLHAYRRGDRRNSEMAAMSAALTEADVDALAAYYSRQNAKSVVYVLTK